MIAVCDYQAIDREEYDEAKRLARLLSGNDEDDEDDDNIQYECYWMPTQIDVSLCVNISEYVNRENASTSCQDATGKAVLYLSDGRNIITSIPFIIMEDIFMYKHQALVLAADESGIWHISQIDDFSFEQDADIPAQG